jgi:hypothetical protein
MKHSGILTLRQFSDIPIAGGRKTYQAKAPMRETNLSSSADPAQLIREQQTTVPALNRFFCHLTMVLCLPDRGRRPFSMILTAGKSCSGMESRMATESAMTYQ